MDKIKSRKGDFKKVFVKTEVKPKKAESLVMLLNEYLYTAFNTDKEKKEAAYGESLNERYFHPSQMAKAKCARQLVYQYLGAEGDMEVKYHSAQTHRIFHNGHDVHSRIQRYLTDLGKFTEGKCVLIGRWKCKACGTGFGYPPEEADPKDFKNYWVPVPEKCNCAGGSASPNSFRYMECGIEDRDLRIKGKMDGVIKWKEESWCVEIKSVNPFEFPKLSAPHENYLVQSNIYQRSSGIPRMVWLYEDKGSQGLKDFITFYDESVLIPVFMVLGNANVCIGAKTYPDRLTGSATSFCKLCEYRQICNLDLPFVEGVGTAHLT